MTSLEDTLARQLREAANQEPDTAAIEQRMTAGFRRRERHRTQQRMALVCAAVVVLVASSVTVLRDADQDPEGIAVLGGTAAPSTFDWSVVNPRNGLAYGLATARTADGTVYSLSTEPGPPQPGTNDLGRTLYRSADGSEWSEATQPPDTQTADVAAAGNTVYSVGTSPSGGLIVSRSTDGAASWTQAHLPDDVAALKREFGAQVVVWRTNVVAMDDTHLIAATSVSADLSLETYRPEYAHVADIDTVWGDAGVTVYDRLDPCGSSDMNGMSQQEMDALTTCLNDLSEEEVRGEQIAAYSYEELGMPSELQELIGGRVFAYASDDGETFDPIDLPIDPPSDPHRLLTAIPLATPDGYRMFVGESPEVGGVVLSSRDGYEWTETGTLPGPPASAGLLGDRAAVALWGTGSVGASTVLVETPDGSWSTVDLASAISAPDDGSLLVEHLRFGPLGLAAIITVLPPEGQGGPSAQYVLHSTDGSTLQVIPVEQVLGGPGHVQGVSVSADAVMVRVVRDRSDGGSGEPVPAVLVGTPR